MGSQRAGHNLAIAQQICEQCPGARVTDMNMLSFVSEKLTEEGLKPILNLKYFIFYKYFGSLVNQKLETSVVTETEEWVFLLIIPASTLPNKLLKKEMLIKLSAEELMLLNCGGGEDS